MAILPVFHQSKFVFGLRFSPTLCTNLFHTIPNEQADWHLMFADVSGIFISGIGHIQCSNCFSSLLCNVHNSDYHC
jgi:hypothetical protein